MSNTIYFYSHREEPHGCFSNFSAHGFHLDGHYWKTSEHYFQAQKFVGTKHEEDIRRAATPNQAARLGRQRSRPLRKDWESVKDGIMMKAVLRKFETHPDIQDILLNTGEQKLVENAMRDSYWGCGHDGKGRNQLGKILMDVRTQLRAARDATRIETNESTQQT